MTRAAPVSEARRVFDDAQARGPFKRGASATPADVRSVVTTFATSLAWSLHVPGSHTSGPSYDELLGYLADQGRDFRADSLGLRRHVKQALIEAFGAGRTVPTRKALADASAAAILEWLVGRIENRVNDVRIKRNESRYAHWKARHGLDSRPGIATGELLGAVKDDGEVAVTT